MTHQYGLTFLELIRTPFTEVNMIWGIVPLYFALFLSELTSTKANFRTAIQTGFSFLWAAAQWLYFFAKSRQLTGTVPAALSQVRLIPGSHTFQQLLHDHHLSDPSPSFRLDLGALDRDCDFCGAGLARAPLRADAIARGKIG
jgi:hypothetical protein